MPLVFTEDPTIGNALAATLGNSISGGPKLRLEAANIGSEIAYRNAQRRQLEEQLNAAGGAIGANRAYWDAQQPPTAPSVALPAGWEGPPSPPTPQEQDAVTGNFNRMRALQEAQYELGARHATSMGDVATSAPKMFAQTQLGLTGVPTTPEGQVTMQTQLKGELPLTFENKPGKNYVIKDAQGNTLEQGITNDNGRTNTVGKRIVPPQGASVLLAGEAPVEQSAFKDPGAMLSALNTSSNKIASGQTLSPDEARQSALIIGQLYPNTQRIEKDDQGNIRVLGIAEKMLPPSLAPLASHINTVLNPTAPATIPGAPGLTPPAGTQPQAGPTPAAAAALPGATQQPPAAQPVVGGGPTISDPLVRGGGHEMRREVMSSQIYQQYLNSMTSYQKIQDAFKSDNLAADLNGIYALAKLFDPGSAVREGELTMAGNTGALGERLMGQYNALAKGGGRLTAEMRRDILNEGYKAANAQYSTMKNIGDAYTGMAQRQGFDPANVVPPVNAPTPYDPSLVNIGGHAPKVAPRAAAPGGGAGPNYNKLDQLLGLTR